MNTIDNYSVVQILEMYKEIIGTDIEKVINNVLYGGSTTFKQEIDKKMSKYVNIQNKKEYLKIRSNLVYRDILTKFFLNSKANDEKHIKLALLCDIERRFSKKMSPKEVEKIKKLILADKPFAIFKYNSDNYPGVYDYEIIISEKQEKLDSIRDAKLKEVLERYFSDFSLVSDINLFMKEKYSKDMHNVIMNKLLIKFFLDENRMSPKEYKNHLSKEDFLEILDNDENLRKEFEKQMKEFFRNNLQFIDKERLLLNLVAKDILGIRLIKGEEIKQLSLEKENEFDEIQSIKYYIDYLKKIYSIINNKKYDNVEKYTIYTGDKEVLISVDKDYLKKFLDRCTENDYLTDKDIEKIHQDILNGILIEDIEKRRIANVNLDDLIDANNRYEEKEEGSLEKDKILRTNIELVKYLLNEKIVTNEDLLNMYLQANLNLKLITGIDMNELSEKYCSNKFKDLYYEMVFTQEPEKTKKLLERFSALYVNLEKNNKIGINRDELVGDIITVLGDQFAPEILSDLHELNFITLEKAIEWVGSDIFFEEYKKGNLKPGEVRRFYQEGKINLDEIASIVNKLDDNGERFMLIGSIFPEETEEDREIRDLLIDECLKIDSEIENNKVGNKRKEGDNKSVEYYKHITDPFARMSLIQAFDEDYSFEMTSDGHAVVRLPNLKSVVIEKMLDKNKEPAYGVATCILDEEYYEENSFRIKKDGKIDRQEVKEDANSKQIIKFSHFINSWGRNIKNYFLYEKKANWSKEKSDKIDEAIERVKRSDKNFMNKCSDQQLAKMILNLMVTRKATLEQVEKIAEIYEVDLGKVMDSLNER